MARTRTDVSYCSTLGYYDIQNWHLDQRKIPISSPEGLLGRAAPSRTSANIAHVHYIVGTDTLSAAADR